MKYSPPSIIDLGTVAANTLVPSRTVVIVKDVRPNSDARNGLGFLGPGSNPRPQS